jgi:hypothetical protein
MYTYRIYTLRGSNLVWTCKASTVDDAWQDLSDWKKLSIIELKKIFKITQYVNRTDDNDGFVND